MNDLRTYQIIQYMTHRPDLCREILGIRAPRSYDGWLLCWLLSAIGWLLTRSGRLLVRTGQGLRSWAGKAEAVSAPVPLDPQTRQAA
jgi:hypothetical protein